MPSTEKCAQACSGILCASAFVGHIGVVGWPWIGPIAPRIVDGCSNHMLDGAQISSHFLRPGMRRVGVTHVGAVGTAIWWSSFQRWWSLGTMVGRVGGSRFLVFWLDFWWTFWSYVFSWLFSSFSSCPFSWPSFLVTFDFSSWSSILFPKQFYPPIRHQTGHF